jgi:CRP-like cAMP-binding protein
MAATPYKYKNRVLAALPQADLDRLFVDLQPVSLPLKQLLYQVGAPLDCVYFIEEGVASVLTSMADGGTIEVGMIGSEGIAGVAALLGAESAAQQIVIQARCAALRMPVAKCREVFDGSPTFRAAALRYVAALLDLSAQTAACNRLHSIEQRCARWFLMARDRTDADVMPMTHEFLASMLGVRRAGITETTGELQRSGLIRNHRGEVTILDRDGLEAAACECYGLDHARLLRLLGPAPISPPALG